MKILITGATGLVGNVLLEKAIAQGIAYITLQHEKDNSIVYPKQRILLESQNRRNRYCLF